MSDKTDISKANGYFIEIGENGSLDNLKFYLTVNGISSLLGSGNPGIFLMPRPLHLSESQRMD